MGRVVKTHSTYVDGLIDVLNKIAKRSDIKTITPGLIRNTKKSTGSLKLKISVKTKYGYKLLAKKGSCIQEVFFITSVSKEELVNIIRNYIWLLLLSDLVETDDSSADKDSNRSLTSSSFKADIASSSCVLSYKDIYTNNKL